MDFVEQGDSDFIRRSNDKTVSLSLDEVNDNPDELIEMRGEGRYFGSGDGGDNSNNGPICQNCHQRGHKKAQCKTVVCIACGMIDDHYSQQCPKSIVCSNCGEKGHFKNQCKQRQRRIYCQTCGSTRHGIDRCPSIWRSYLTKNDDKKLMGLPSNMYCYNCAEKGHYGDECQEQRSSRVPNIDGSAFSGHNLPKQLRDKYFSLHQKRKRQEEEEEEEEEEEDDDYADESLRSYVPNNDLPAPKKKKSLFSRLKTTFKSNDDEGPSRKKVKKEKPKDKGKEKKKSKKAIRNVQSMPELAKTGTLPPRGPSMYSYPRNPNYSPNGSNYYGNESYGSNYNNNYNNYNNNNYYNSNSYNNSQNGYSRSGYIEPPRPNRSGNFGGNGRNEKRGRR